MRRAIATNVAAMDDMQDDTDDEISTSLLGTRGAGETTKGPFIRSSRRGHALVVALAATFAAIASSPKTVRAGSTFAALSLPCSIDGPLSAILHQVNFVAESVSLPLIAAIWSNYLHSAHYIGPHALVIFHVNALMFCIVLQSLYVGRYKSLASVGVLLHFPNLQILTLDDLKSLDSVDALSRSPSLHSLKLHSLKSLGSVDLSGCASLQSLELSNLESLTSVRLSGCAALKKLTFNEYYVNMDKLTSMPDLSALAGLEVTGLPSQLQAWEDSGRKRLSA